MNVHIDFSGRHLDKKEHYRIDRRRQNIAIRLDDAVLNEAVANQASINENIDRIAIELLNFRLRNKTMQSHFTEIVWRGRPRQRSPILDVAGSWLRLRSATPWRRLRQADALQRLHGRERNQLVEGFASKNLIHALTMTGHGWRDQQGVGRRVQLKMLVGMGQCVVRYQGRDVGEFRRFRLQKFLARRNVEKQIANCDRSSKRQPRFFDADDLAAVDFEDRSRSFFCRAGFQMKAGNGCNGGQRLAAKSQGCNVQQVVRLFDFRGGVTLEGQHGIVAYHAATVVDDLDQLLAARFDLNADARGTRVQRVLQQLFHH